MIERESGRLWRRDTRAAAGAAVRGTLRCAALLYLATVSAGAAPALLRIEPQASGSTASLRGLAVVDRSVVWASGAKGTVLRTTDAGRTWVRIDVPGYAEADFRDIHAWDARRAVLMVAGQPAHLLRTRDGGDHWRTVFRDDRPDSFYDALAFFAGGRRGICFGDPQQGRMPLLVSDDMGSRWQRLPEAQRPQMLENEGGFAASGSCLVTYGPSHAWIGLGGASAGRKARVWRSTDGGRSWQVAVTPIAGSESAGIFSLAFWSPRQGVAVGGDYRRPDRSQGNIALTNDGGRTWRAPGHRPGGYRSAVALVPRKESTWLIACGPNGVDLSQDAGQHWTSHATQGFHSLVMADAHRGWAVGAGGRIARLRIP